jgi:hypothetical protein
MSCICVFLPAFWQDILAAQTTAVTAGTPNGGIGADQLAACKQHRMGSNECFDGD